MMRPTCLCQHEDILCLMFEISPKKLQPFVCEKFVTKPVLPDLHFAKEVCRLKNIEEAQRNNYKPSAKQCLYFSSTTFQAWRLHFYWLLERFDI